MAYFTSNTYKMKRKILTFSNKISERLTKPEQRFSADITYGILASGSCLLTDIADQLHEDSMKINTVDRLSRHLVTEACVLTTNNHPVSIYSRIHSSSEKNYKSANTITFDAIEQGASLFGKATFCMDRGYDDNKMFLKLDELEQDYVIRLKSNRKLLYHNKWTMATELRDRRKGKIKMNLFYRGKDREAYLSHVIVQITASRKNIYLVLVYGITEHPMMLATNKEKVFFCYYRLAKGISGILSYAKEGVRLWFRTKRPKYRQLCLRMNI